MRFLAAVRSLMTLLTVLTMAPGVALAAPDAEVSLPWLLRPATTADLARVDSAVAAFDDANGNLDLALTTTFTGSYRLASGWAPTLRLGVVDNDAPGAAHDDNAFANPLVGVSTLRPWGDARLVFSGAAALPVGTGGERTATATATARPADRALWERDFATLLAGVDVAYVRGHLTAQGELTLSPARRVRGDGAAWSTRLAAGLHVGYVIGARVAVGADLHHEDRFTAALGVRVQLRVGAHTWLRPGLALVRGLDARGLGAPLLTTQTTSLTIDVPVTF